MMTEDRLRALYGAVSPRAAVKVLDRLDSHCRAFVGASPFMVLGTSDGTTLDVSPKGDPAGFVQVEDDRHLLIPDRPGNNRLDGLLNILRHPQVALIFLIPSVDETLRVNGHATIHDDADLCARCALKGRVPKTVLRVRIDEAYLHCGKAPMRAGLWAPDSWPSDRPVATLNEILRDQVGIAPEDLSQQAVEAGYRRTLY